MKQVKHLGPHTPTYWCFLDIGNQKCINPAIKRMSSEVTSSFHRGFSEKKQTDETRMLSYETIASKAHGCRAAKSEMRSSEKEAK